MLPSDVESRLTRDEPAGTEGEMTRTSIGALLVLGLAPGHGAEAQEPRLIEIADMFEMRSVGAPVVSPDGEWIAYTVGRTSLEDELSYTRIYMAPAEGGEPVALTADGKSAGSPGWSPDGRYITFTASRDEGQTQVWALDRRGGEAFTLTEVEQGVSGYRWSPDGTRLLLTIRDPEEEDKDEKPDAPRDPWVIDRLQFKRDNTGYLTGNRRTHLYVLDLESEELSQLTSGRWDESLGRWSPDGTRIAFVSNRTEEPDGNENSDLWVVSASLQEPTDSPTRLTTNEGSDGSPAWSPDGRSITYTTGIRPDLIWYATTHLAVISADGGQPRLLTTDLDRNVSQPRFSEDGEWIWFRLEDSGENHLSRIREDGSGLQRPVSGALSAGAFDWAGSTFAASLTYLDRPGEIYRVTGAQDGSAELSRVTSHNDEFLASVRVAETRTIEFRSADGTPVEGFVTFPPDFVEGQQYPTLLRIHGGPVSQYNHSFNFESQLFAANGYLVVRTNPRGSSGYGQDFSAALWADWGTPDFQDVMAGVDYTIAQGWADPDRLGVGGWSYGGILTNYVITQTNRFQGAVTGASEVLYIANYGHDHYQRQWEAELGLPWEGDNREQWERISPFNRVEHIETPTLIMGGEDDWNVPIQNSEQLYQALRRRGVETQLVVYPGQSHGIRVPSYQVDRYERYLAWYDEYVRGAARPVS
jgi:dipeptidyl aminopeptidase/acylaminoacyl peptidase